MTKRAGGRMTESRKVEAGYVAVSVALTIVLLCAFAALAVDVGVLLAARAGAQRAADAGALAGAFTFVTQSWAPQPEAVATQHAQATALANRVLDQPINAGDVAVAVNVPNRRVTVDITHTRRTFFARAFGRSWADIKVQGIAEASANSTGSSCVKPWFIPNTVISELPTCQACAEGQVFIGPDGNVTQYAKAMAQTGPRFTVKPGNPHNALGPGEFYAIRLGDSTGGNDYRENIATCSPEVVYCSQLYGAEPGNMIGPTVQGVDDLCGPTPDVFVRPGEYQRTDGTMSDTSQQLAIAPIWDTCNTAGFCPSGQPPDGGANFRVAVIGFALIFIEGRQGNDVLARLVWASSCSAFGGGGPAPPETGPLSIPVRLVRVP